MTGYEQRCRAIRFCFVYLRCRGQQELGDLCVAAPASDPQSCVAVLVNLINHSA